MKHLIILKTYHYPVGPCSAAFKAEAIIYIGPTVYETNDKDKTNPKCKIRMGNEDNIEVFHTHEEVVTLIGQATGAHIYGMESK